MYNGQPCLPAGVVSIRESCTTIQESPALLLPVPVPGTKWADKQKAAFHKGNLIAGTCAT